MKRRNFFAGLFGAALVASIFPKTVWSNPRPIIPTKTALDDVNSKQLVYKICQMMQDTLQHQKGEYNDFITRNNVTKIMSGYLKQLENERLLYDYAVICDDTNNTPEVIDAYGINLGVVIRLTGSPEHIYITSDLKSNPVT
jgi:hypothetical protein